MIQLLKELWERLHRAPEEKVQSPFESASTPSWRTEVVIHPNYWVESNFTRVDKLAPLLKDFIDAALHDGRIKDVSREIATDTISLLRETLVIQLHANIGVNDGAWEVKHKDDVLQVTAQVKDGKKWDQVVSAWASTQKIVVEYGIQLSDSKEEWDHASLTGHIKVHTKQLRLDVDSSLLWTVLYRSRKFPILWKNKLWMPK